MPLTIEDILAVDPSLLGREELMRIKQRMTERIIDMYFDNEFSEDMQERVVAWLLDGDNAEAKEAAMLRRFEAIFGENEEGAEATLSARTGAI